MKEEEVLKSNTKLFGNFCKYIHNLNSDESNYLLEKMLEKELIDTSFIKTKRTLYFSHLNPKKQIENLKLIKFSKDFNSNFEELSKNDWELHKKLIKEGVNPNELAKIIRNDEIEKLQKISAQTNFNFNQTIAPSLYERYTFVNKNNVSLIDYAAFFSAVKCFKFLLMNGSNIKNTGKFAIAGGNLEIFHLCIQNQAAFEKAYEVSIEYHRNDIFHYIYENKIIKIEDYTDLLMSCIEYCDFSIFLFLEEEGIEINDFILEKSAMVGNIFLIKHFLGYERMENVKIIEPILKKEENDLDFENIF